MLGPLHILQCLKLRIMIIMKLIYKITIATINNKNISQQEHPLICCNDMDIYLIMQRLWWSKEVIKLTSIMKWVIVRIYHWKMKVFWIKVGCLSSNTNRQVKIIKHVNKIMGLIYLMMIWNISYQRLMMDLYRKLMLAYLLEEHCQYLGNILRIIL